MLPTTDHHFLPPTSYHPLLTTHLLQADANYSLQIFDMAHPSDNICADKCDWSSLGDGDCDSQCDNEACFLTPALTLTLTLTL